MAKTCMTSFYVIYFRQRPRMKREIGWVVETKQCKRRLWFVLWKSRLLGLIWSNILMIVCGTTHMETVNCIVCRCDNIKKGYKWYYKKAIKIMYWKLCEHCGLYKNEKWCKDDPEPVTENELMKLLQDLNIHCDLIPELKRHDIAIVDKVEKNVSLLLLP